MATSFELVWSSDGTERAIPVRGVVTIGRGPGNDLVLPGAEVSYQHARLWVEDGKLYVLDIGSTNGTFVGQTRISSQTELEEGSVLRMGEHSLTIRTITGAEFGGSRWMIEDLDSGLRRPISLRFVIGSGPDAHLRVDDAEAVIHNEDIGFVLETEDERRVLEEDVEENVGSLRFKLVEVGKRAPQRTARPSFAEDCYHVQASLDARTPWARIESDDGAVLEVEGEARATLVYVLAKQVAEDRARGISPDEEGWIDDHDVAAQVWGRTGRAGVGNKLSVVVYRLRADLKKRDMKDSFVERKRGRTRLKAGRVSLGE